MAKRPEQVDFAGGKRERSQTDLAIAKVKGFQAGKETGADVAEALTGLSPKQLLVVSIGTRLPVRSLEALCDL